MPADDNVSPFPSNADRLVKRAMHAQQEYAAAIADTIKGQRQAINALIEYGEALRQGREGRSNQAFSTWVHENGLDQGDPWSDPRERSCAKKMAEIIFDTGIEDTFKDCPNNRPGNIMIWYRKLHPSPEAKDRATATAKAMEAIKQMEAAGEPISEDRIQLRAGVAAGTANKAFAIHRKTKEAAEQATAETTARLTEDQYLKAAEAKLSDKSKVTIQKTLEILVKRQQKQFNAAVFAEVQRRVTKADNSTRKHNSELHTQNLRMQQLLNQKALFTPGEFKVILMALHPDNSASPEVRARAFDLVRQKERRLVSTAVA